MVVTFSYCNDLGEPVRYQVNISEEHLTDLIERADEYAEEYEDSGE